MSSCMWWDHFAVFKILSLFYFSTFWLKCAWVWIFLCLSYFVIIGVCRTSHIYVFYIRLGSYQPLFCQILFLPHSLLSFWYSHYKHLDTFLWGSLYFSSLFFMFSNLYQSLLKFMDSFFCKLKSTVEPFSDLFI